MIVALRPCAALCVEEACDIVQEDVLLITYLSLYYSETAHYEASVPAGPSVVGGHPGIGGRPMF